MFLYSYNELQNVQHENKDLEVDSHINLYTADFASHFINRKWNKQYINKEHTLDFSGLFVPLFIIIGFYHAAS